MSHLASLFTYSWRSFINGKPFEIQVFAHNATEARQHVIAILDEIARVKPEHEALDKAYGEAYAKYYEASRGNPAAESPLRSVDGFREQLRATADKIPANFFNGCFAAGTFDYTPDQIVGLDDETTLGEFIRTTEPTCSGAVRLVSFRSCLDG
jgi:hypothetical protein